MKGHPSYFHDLLSSMTSWAFPILINPARPFLLLLQFSAIIIIRAFNLIELNGDGLLPVQTQVGVLIAVDLQSVITILFVDQMQSDVTNATRSKRDIAVPIRLEVQIICEPGETGVDVAVLIACDRILALSIVRALEVLQIELSAVHYLAPAGTLVSFLTEAERPSVVVRPEL